MVVAAIGDRQPSSKRIKISSPNKLIDEKKKKEKKLLSTAAKLNITLLTTHMLE